jgi:hypothetical protein
MTKIELMRMLKDMPDDMEILIPLELKFTGDFYTPSKKSSGFMKLFESEINEDEDEELSAILDPHRPHINAFLLCPEGFFEEEDTSYLWN